MLNTQGVSKGEKIMKRIEGFRKMSVKRLAFILVTAVFLLLTACSETGTPEFLEEAKLEPYFGSKYSVLGADMGDRYQNLRISKNDVIQDNLSVKVNGVKIPFTTVGYPGYHGQVDEWLADGDYLHLEVVTPEGVITAQDTIPEAPIMTAPSLGTILDVTQPIEVQWTSDTEPDRFNVGVSWSCGESCGTGINFNVAAVERSFRIPPDSIPAGTRVSIRVFSYNDGSETFEGPFVEGSKMSIRGSNGARDEFETIAPDTPNCTNPATFEDANLETAIREELSLSGSISSADLAELRWLQAQERNISSLKGLECAVNLEALNASDNNISDLSPLASLSKMKRLSLNKNAISDISALTELTDIYQLRLSLNPLTDISALAPLVNMGLLTLDSTNISDISVVEHFPRLNTFYAANNSLSNLAALRGKHELVSLRIRNNSIEDLEPLYGLTKLRVVDLSSNEIHDVNPLGSLDALEHLFLMNNPINEATTVGLSNARNLKYLNMGSTGISSLNFVHNLNNIEELIVYNNRITDLSPIAPLNKLTMLHIQLNQIEDISVIENFRRLEYFYALSNRIHDISVLDGLALKRVTLSTNFVSTLEPFTSMPSLTSLTVQRNCLDLEGDDKTAVEQLTEQLDRFLFETQKNPSDC